MKKIMILGASILQLPAIEKAKEMGLAVVAVDMNPQAIGFSVPDIEREVISTIDIPNVVLAAKRHQINGVMTLASDMPMRSVAAVAQEMHLVGIDADTAVKATNKADMRAALKAGGVPVPMFFKVTNEAEYLQAVRELPRPFIVKPADNSGSRGIYKIEIDASEDEILYAYRYSRDNSRGGDVVAEEYMSGPEVSVETLTVDGVCHVIQITDKLTTGAPHFVEMGHSQPSRLDPEIRERIAEVAKAANRAIGIKNGPSHTEIIVTADGPKIVELGARLGGDCITTHLVPMSTGVDMVKCCIQIALGEKPDITAKWHKGSAIRYFSQHAGTVTKIDGIQEAEKMPGIRQVSVVHAVGETITSVDSSAARMGFVIAQDDTPEIAVRDCENALKTIKVEIEE